MTLKELEGLSELELALQVIGAMRRKIDWLTYMDTNVISNPTLSATETALVSGAINAYDTICSKAAQPEDFRRFALDILRNI